MQAGIYLIQAVRQYAYGVYRIVQCRTVAMDVYPVGQSAYHQHIRAKIGQFGHETAANIFPVFRAVARAYHVDDMCPVQVGVSFVVKQ